MDKDGRKKIVVLDDNEIFAELIAAALEEHCRVLLGHTGLQGIAYFQEGGVAPARDFRYSQYFMGTILNSPRGRRRA